jgi:hypothetical protein
MTELEEEDNIINKWTQEDVNRLYSLLNNNNNNNKPRACVSIYQKTRVGFLRRYFCSLTHFGPSSSYIHKTLSFLPLPMLISARHAISYCFC